MVTQTARLDFRLTKQNHHVVSRAAQLLGQPVTAFAVQTLVARAEEVLADETRRRLSATDWKKFMAIMSNDTPNAALKALMKKPRTLSIQLKPKR
jgi:uncharacterized protein (DUF1778 family)